MEGLDTIQDLKWLTYVSVTVGLHALNLSTDVVDELILGESLTVVLVLGVVERLVDELLGSWFEKEGRFTVLECAIHAGS